MGRKPSPEAMERRERAIKARETITRRYLDDLDALSTLAAEYGVDQSWLSQQLHTWGVQTRNTAEARRARVQRVARERDGAAPGGVCGGS